MDKDTRALRKAHQAALALAKALALMHEAADLVGDGGVGHGDYLHCAFENGQLLSCDNGEAGIGPGLTAIGKSITQRSKAS